ncbi:VanZ family protein [Microbacterium sp. M3]|uniref:VanZ family protein n=1 Tax=Microbacterium arthrosphaerae TaxID=792652 RepID=A0ABU4H3F8_9MICO|nr:MULTISPECIES: VanZ family protein [Microbacterium]MDW4573873.1 VanZ family protein [Microbacterium arthrosphaerae]MDW7607728.1 VanZ family protein [Microbacterium sp. M3]
MSGGRLPSTSGPRHAIIVMMALGYGIFLAFVVFWPSPIDAPVQGLLERAIAELHERGVPTFIDYDFIESFANILLFIPVGFLFGLMIPLRWWPIALLLGPALSAAIELAQRYVLDERVSTVQDVIANSIGSTIGVLIAVVIRAIVKARDEQVIARHEAQVRGSTPA